MTAVLDVGSAVMLLAGSVLALVAAVGVVRNDDTFVRIHIATKPATLSLALMVGGAVLQMPGWETGAKLVVALVLQFVTTPVASHLLGRAVRQDEAVPEAPH